MEIDYILLNVGGKQSRPIKAWVQGGSMGTRSYIARGLGNPESFESCSHGAGRSMSRGEAKRRFTTDDLARQTAGVECRRDTGILDEIPAAYKDIDAVMEAQRSLVEPVFTLRQLLCVKG